MTRDYNKLWIAAGCIAGGLAVAAGAFGAHGLKKMLEPDMLAIFDTGARYQMYHAVALVLAGLVGTQVRGHEKALRTAGWLFLTGIALFSGSLYALALSGVKMFGMITPFGGAAFIAGWWLLGWSILRATLGRNGASTAAPGPQ